MNSIKSDIALSALFIAATIVDNLNVFNGGTAVLFPDPKVPIFCDLGKGIGGGHVLRSVVLARALKVRGLAPTIYADYASAPAWVEERVRSLAVEPAQCESFSEFSQIAANTSDIEFSIVDSYTVSTDDLRIWTPSAPVMFFDDGQQNSHKITRWRLANPKLRVAVLSPGITGFGLEDVHAQWGAEPILHGTEYLLLDPAYLKVHLEGFPEPEWNDKTLNFLVVLGATDAINATLPLCQGIERATAELGKQSSIRILTDDRKLAGQLQALPTVEVGPPASSAAQMGAEMRRADMFVGAPGGMMWEALCIGTPTVLGYVADNQLANYRFANNRYVAGLGDLRHPSSTADAPHAIDADTVCERLLSTNVLDTEQAHARARAGFELVDGKGPERVAECLIEHFWRSRNQARAQVSFRNGHPAALPDFPQSPTPSPATIRRGIS